MARRLLLLLALLVGFAAPARAQSSPNFFGNDDAAFVAAAGTSYNNNPGGAGRTMGFWDGSDMDYAPEHDARWGLAATSHATGAMGRMEGLLARGNTFFLKTGDAFTKILDAYQTINRMMILYNQMKSMADFMKTYRLNVNLFAFMPLVDINAPDEMGGGQAYAVGFLPKDSQGWQARANLFGDNAYYKKPGGLRLVSVRYPHSLNDITMNASVWQADSVPEEEFEKRMMAGMYDGVMSSSLFLDRMGISNNAADNVAGMGPKAMARHMSEAIQRRIDALETRKQLLLDASMGQAPLPPGMTPQQVLDQIAAIVVEEQSLKAQDQMGEATINAQNEPWMREASFVTEILTKLEQPQRRLALMKLNERYLKYEKYWADPDQMDPTPEITGDKRVDNAIYIIWQALTLLSKGKIPPPQGVPGGPAAIAQSTMVRSMYRQFFVDELRAVRRLIEFRYETDLQQQGADVVVKDGQQEVKEMQDLLQAHADNIEKLKAFAQARAIIVGQGYAVP